MRKYIYIAILFLLCSGRASAQFTLVSGTVTDVNGIAYACGTISANIVNNNGQSLYLNGVQFSPSPSATKLGCPTDASTSRTPGAFSVQLADNTQIKCGSGASIVTCGIQTQWLFTVNTTGIPPPGGTGPQTCNATLTISGSLQSVSSNFNTCPSLSIAVGSSPNGNTIQVSASKYNLPAGSATISVCDATYTNASATVTTPSTDPAFTTGTTYPIVWGFSGMQCGGNPLGSFPFGGVQLVPTNATATATGAHTLILSSPALAGCTPGGQGLCSLVAGVSAFSAINAAYTDTVSGGNAASMQLPSGNFILDNIPTGGTFPCTNTGSGNDTPCFLDIGGQGFSTVLLFAPSVTFPNHLFFPSNATTNGVMFLHYHHMALSSFSPATAGQASQSVLLLPFGGEVDHTLWFDMFPQFGTNFTCVNMTGTANSITSFHDNQVLNACGTAITANVEDINISSNWIQGSNACLAALGSRIKTWGNRITLCGTNGAIVMNSGTDDLESDDTAIESQGTSLPVVNISAAAGTTWKAHNPQIIAAQTTGPALGISSGNTAAVGGEICSITSVTGSANAVNNAGTFQVDHCNMTLGASSGVSLNNSGTLINGPGNNYSSGITNTGTITGNDGNGVLQGACTGTVTSATTVGLYTLGQTTVTTCTSTTVANGRVMPKPGTIYALYCTAGTAGNQATDACTLVKNGSAQSMTCSLNGVTSCTDGTVGHQNNFVQGDIISVEIIGGAATTLANVKGTLVTN